MHLQQVIGAIQSVNEDLANVPAGQNFFAVLETNGDDYERIVFMGVEIWNSRDSRIDTTTGLASFLRKGISHVVMDVSKIVF